MTSSRRVAALALILIATHSRVAAAGEVALVEDTDGALAAAAQGFLPQAMLSAVACAFYRDHPDRYGALIFFTTFPLGPLQAVPTGWPVRRPATGVGLDAWPDQRHEFCAPGGTLRHVVKMGELAAFADDPDGPYNGFARSMSAIEVLGHEIGHQWLALASFDRGDGQRRCLHRAFNGGGGAEGSGASGACDGYSVSAYAQHWSFYFNAPSLMFGNAIDDLGAGRFRVTHAAPRYTPLDQYLMGLRDAAEVPPMFAVDRGDPASSGSQAPPLMAGETQEVSGTRVDFTIADVIRAEGPRVPAVEPCHWKGAFVLVHPPGAPPSAAEIAKVDAYRQRWESFFATATEGRGSFDTTLAGTGAGTAGCPASGIRPDAGPADAGARDAGAPDLAVDAGPGPRAGDTAAPAADPAEDGGCGCSGGAAPLRHGGVWLAVAALLACALRRPRPRPAPRRRAR